MIGTGGRGAAIAVMIIIKSRRLAWSLTGLLIMLPILRGRLLGAVVEGAAETIEAGVEITGAVVGAGIDVIVPDDEENDRD